MRAAVIAAALALSTSLASVAAAQPGLTPPGMTPPTADLESPPAGAAPITEPVAEPVNEKSPTTATLLALTGTLAPMLIIREAADESSEEGVMLGVVGMVLLPSLGHWYAGKVATPGMGMRVAGGAVSLLALSVLVESDGEADGIETVFWLGAGTFVAGTIYDIATAGNAARDWNTKHAAVRPTVVHTSIGGGTGVGLATSF